MILKDDGWPCFAGRSCGRGRPQPQCGWGSVRIGGVITSTVRDRRSYAWIATGDRATIGLFSVCSPIGHRLGAWQARPRQPSRARCPKTGEKMILKNDGWPCFAGRSCGRGRPQPQCRRASVRIRGVGVRKNQIFSFLRGGCNGQMCGRGSVRIGGGSCFLVVLLVCQPECPEREDVACAVFYIVFHDIAVGNLMDLFFPLVLSAHLECRSIDFKVADT